MIRLISIFLYLIFYVNSPYFAFAVSPDEKDKKQVLVVHSYHIGYAWTGEVMNGVRDVLNKQSDLEVFIEYLDAKRYFGKAYFENMKQIYRDKYKNRGIDVIIISDDEAFDLVLEIRAECFPNVPIAVCGLNQDLKIISNINFAYVAEGGHDGIRSTIDLILSLQPDIETVFFVSDDSKTGKSKLQTVRQLQPAYKEKVGFKYLSGMCMDELQAALRKLPKKSAVFNLIFIRDSSGKVFSIKDSSQMIGNSARVPVYRSWGFQPDTSIMGGHINTGFVHGKKTAQIAMKLLNNEEKLKIPSIQKVDLLYMFDYRAMKRFNIGIKDIPENSVVYNKPFSIYENYRWHILGIIIFMIAQALLMVLMLINQKKRKQVEEALRDSEEKFRHLMEQSPFSIQIIKPDGRIDQINKAFMKLWGISQEMLPEILEKYNVLEDEEARKLGLMPLIEKACRGETVILPEIEYDASRTMEKLKIVGTDSKKVWIHVRLYPIKNSKGEVVNVVFIEEDITERKEAEEKIQEYQERLRALAAQLTLTEEKERRRIATDLHDHVGQSLALARIQIAAVCKSATDAGQAAKLDGISEILREAVHDTRHLMFDLSPPAMHQIGLGAAISEWLEDQIEKRYGIKTEFFDNLDKSHRKVLDENVRAILFRNVRELLVNVVKHAQANQVTVLMEVTDGVLKIVVQDDGVGFDSRELSQPEGIKGGFGLFSIEERMTDLGGALEIESQPGKGGRAILTVPLELKSK